jgi:hypothetical protein
MKPIVVKLIWAKPKLTELEVSNTLAECSPTKPRFGVDGVAAECS